MTARPNPLRGESALTVAGTAYVLRPSFENLVLAEAELGSLFALVERAAQGALTLAEMPAHNHGGTTARDGAHYHRIKVTYQGPIGGPDHQLPVYRTKPEEVEFLSALDQDPSATELVE